METHDGPLLLYMNSPRSLPSALLYTLVDKTPLTAGRRTVGETVRFGYYDQRGLQPSSANERVLDFVVSQVCVRARTHVHGNIQRTRTLAGQS